MIISSCKLIRRSSRRKGFSRRQPPHTNAEFMSDAFWFLPTSTMRANERQQQSFMMCQMIFLQRTFFFFFSGALIDNVLNWKHFLIFPNHLSDSRVSVAAFPIDILPSTDRLLTLLLLFFDSHGTKKIHWTIFLFEETSSERKRKKKIKYGLTVIFAWMSYFFPFFEMKRHVSSSTLALTIWKSSWLFVNSFSRVFISDLRLFKQTAIVRLFRSDFLPIKRTLEFKFRVFFDVAYTPNWVYLISRFSRHFKSSVSRFIC